MTEEEKKKCEHGLFESCEEGRFCMCETHNRPIIVCEALAAQKAELKAKVIGFMSKKFVMSGEVLYAFEELKKQIEAL